MIIEQSKYIIREVKKALKGKDDIIEKVLMTIYAGGHVLLEDCPGVGKTTLALGFSKALGLDYKRVQFTPDTMPSDITGFTIYNRKTDAFEYHPGAAVCNLFLGDEINRTSPKTQAALLETMEEGSVTVDGETHFLPKPFICIATQNPVGAAGTQPLPESQLDRFAVRLSIGYPSADEQIDIIKSHLYTNPLDQVQTVATKDDILEVQNYINSVRMTDEILMYMTRLCEQTRSMPLVELGVSPRGVIVLSRMARAHAVLRDRDYVVPEDVQEVFADVCAHRLVLRPQARIEGVSERDIIEELLADNRIGGNAKR